MQLTAQQAKEFLAKKIKGGERIAIDDTIIIVSSAKEMRGFIQNDTTHKYTYIPNVFDCEDFADVMTGNASLAGVSFGTAHVKLKGMATTHMCNIALVHNVFRRLELWLVEPQVLGKRYDVAEVETVIRGRIKSGRKPKEKVA